MDSLKPAYLLLWQQLLSTEPILMQVKRPQHLCTIMQQNPEHQGAATASGCSNSIRKGLQVLPRQRQTGRQLQAAASVAAGVHSAAQAPSTVPQLLVLWHQLA